MMPRAIWEVTPHLSGDAHWQRLLLALKVYSDESGKGDPIAFVMAGFVARAEEWGKLEVDWRQMLDGPPRLEAFHMVERVAAKDFARIRAAGAILRKYRFPIMAVTIFMQDYNAVIKGRIGPRLDTPYFPACQMIMEMALRWEIDHGIDEPIDFIFDEQKHESDFLQSIWTPLADGLPPELRNRFGQRPTHADDTKYAGLQAADMVAWSVRRLTACAYKGVLPDGFLAGLFDGVPMRQIVWTGDEMAAFLAYVRRRSSALGHVTFHEFAELAQNKDILVAAANRSAITKARPGEVVPLLAIPAKGIGRFLLVDKCPHSDKVHLHKRAGDECLAARSR